MVFGKSLVIIVVLRRIQWPLISLQPRGWYQGRSEVCRPVHAEPGTLYTLIPTWGPTINASPICAPRLRLSSNKHQNDIQSPKYPPPKPIPLTDSKHNIPPFQMAVSLTDQKRGSFQDKLHVRTHLPARKVWCLPNVDLTQRFGIS